MRFSFSGKVFIPEDEIHENCVFLKYRCTGKEIKMKIRNFVIFWLFRIALNLVSLGNKATFHKLENFERKKISTELHREFIQICLKENLLPKYTNIYLYILEKLARNVRVFPHVPIFFITLDFEFFLPGHVFLEKFPVDIL